MRAPVVWNSKHVDLGDDIGVEVVTCPHCNGVFGADWTYLDQVSETVRCPMCGRKVTIAEDKAEVPEIP